MYQVVVLNFHIYANPTTTFDGSETTANLNPTNSNAVTVTAEWTTNCNFELSSLDNVNWTYSHSGHGTQTRGLKYDSSKDRYYYNFEVGGAIATAVFYRHTFTTDLIPINCASTLYFYQHLGAADSYPYSSDTLSGRVVLYDKDGNTLYTSTKLAKTEDYSLSIPEGGFSIYLTYYGPGNWGASVGIIDVQF